MRPECSNPTAECPHPELWRMDDDTSAECEVGDFIRSLVDTVKPRLVVETGTHLGRTAAKIAIALNYIEASLPISHAQRGKLITCDPQYYEDAEERLKGLKPWVEYRQCSSLDLIVEGTIDILFCDSDPRIRMKEVLHFWDNLTPNSLILIHDVNTDCHNQLRQQVREAEDLIEGTSLNWSVIFLPTPRGLAICQKR